MLKYKHVILQIYMLNINWMTYLKNIFNLKKNKDVYKPIIMKWQR